MLPTGHPQWRRGLKTPLWAGPIAMLAGCVHQSSDGAGSTFRYEYWVPFCAFMAGLVAAPAGWFLRRYSNRYGWTLLILGPVGAFVFAPSLFYDRVTMNEEGFHVQAGFWGQTSVHDVKFDQVRNLKIISETSRGRRGAKRTNYYFLCEMKSGEAVKVPVNSEITKAAAAPILDQISARGIPITDET